MSIARSSIVRGPGIVALGAQVFHTEGDIDAAIEKERFDVRTSMHGNVDSRRQDRRGSISFTPAGELEGLATLYPYQNPVIGDSIMGSSDTAAYAHSRAGKKVTFHAAAIRKMPDLRLGATKTLFGQAEILCLTKDNTAPEGANSLYTVATTALSDATFATANVKTQVFSAAWGGIFASILADDGWTISFDVGLRMHAPDGLGTIDALLENVGVMAKCRPYNLAEADILDAMDLQGAGGAIGATERTGTDLVIQSASLVVTIKDAALVEGPLKWGTTELRAGEIGFVAHRAEAAGVFGALFTLATV